MPGESFVVAVKVIPRSTQSAVVGQSEDGALRVKVNAVPEKGKANDEVCRVLAAHFGVPRSHVEVISGHTGQQKRVRVTRAMGLSGVSRKRD